MGRIGRTQLAAATTLAALLAACSGTPPPARVPLQDAESLTRAALAATRMGARAEVRTGADGQVALVKPGAPQAVAAVPQPVVPPPTVTAQVTIPPVIGKPPAPAPAAPSSDRNQEVQQMLLAWRLAWELGDFGNYVRFYDPEFKGDAPSRRQWEKQRRARLANSKIGVRMDNVRTTLLSDDEAEVQFVQHYSSGKHTDVGNKRMKIKRVAGAWRITQESWSPRR